MSVYIKQRALQRAVEFVLGDSNNRLRFFQLITGPTDPAHNPYFLLLSFNVVQAGPTRELCSSVLLTFLLDYPLGTRRLQQHLHFLLRNLSFEYSAGRQAAASTLRALTHKLPAPLLDSWAPVFFLPLVAQLVNDAEAGCRKELSAAVQAIFQVGGPAVTLWHWQVGWLAVIVTDKLSLCIWSRLARLGQEVAESEGGPMSSCPKSNSQHLSKSLVTTIAGPGDVRLSKLVESDSLMYPHAYVVASK